MDELKETQDANDNKPQLELGEKNTPKIGSKGIQSIQGYDTLIPEPVNPAQKGSDFEKSASSEVFHDEARRLVIRPEDNSHLGENDDGVGITKNRRVCDAYINQDGSIWELKSGYEKGGIDQDQLYEYSLMEQAGYVNVRKGYEFEEVSVKSVNYLFETKAGAEANNSALRGMATPWYKDEAGNVQLYQEETKG